MGSDAISGEPAADSALGRGRGEGCLYEVSHLLWQQDLLTVSHARRGEGPYPDLDLDPDLVAEAEAFPELPHWSMATRDFNIPVRLGP